MFRQIPKSAKCLDSNSYPDITLIIAAYNEEAFIERKMLNCLALDYPEDKLNIIIGSDGSDDNTNSILERFDDNKRLSIFLHKERRGKMAVVNDAVCHANGEICVFSDVSELFDKNALKYLVANFNDPNIGAVTGNHVFNTSDKELSRWTSMYWKYQRWLQKIESKVLTIMSCDGTIYACRRRIYVPPPAGTINDDRAVPLEIIRKGFRVIFEPNALARGSALPEYKSYFAQKVRGQAGMYQIFSQFRDMFYPHDFYKWFIFISHSFGQVMVSWLLLIVFLSNILLVLDGSYISLFVLQLMFYSTALMGFISQKWKINTFILQIPYFFCLSNLASLVGFYTYLFKSTEHKWKKVE